MDDRTTTARRESRTSIQHLLVRGCAEVDDVFEDSVLYNARLSEKNESDTGLG
jgi:hypothetical protein